MASKPCRPFRTGYSINSFQTALSGTSRDYAESSSNILFAFGLALILIYLVLAAQFESFIDPFAIMLTVPLALAGALLSLWIFGQTLNIFSEIGMIMLIGLVTKNGILIVEFANQKREHGLEKMHAVVEASAQRLRPILMTSLATSLGALPIALSLGAASTSRIPLGIVVVGGILFSLILTLFVIPAVYTYISGKHKTKVIGTNALGGVEASVEVWKYGSMGVWECNGQRSTVNGQRSTIEIGDSNKILMKRIVFFLCFVMFFGVVAAQQLTLDTAIAIALKNSPGLMISRYNIDIAIINNHYGIAGGLPVVQGNLSATQQMTSLQQEYSNPLNNKNSNNANSTNLNSGIAASMPVYEGSRIVNEKKRLEVVEAQTKFQYSSRAQTLIYNVMLKYYDVVRQQGYSRTLEASIRASNQRLEIVKQQQTVGVANDADLFQSQVDLNTQVQSLTAQELVIQQAKTDLLTLLYLNPDSSIIVKDTIIVDKSILLDSILSAAYQNPDIQAAYEQIRINQYLEREVSAQRYPSASLNAGYNFSRTTNPQGFNILNQAYGPIPGSGGNRSYF